MSARFATARGFRCSLVLAVAAGLLEAPRAMAQDTDREIEVARKTEAPLEVYKALEQLLERHRREHRGPRDAHLLEILEGLEHGLVALEQLGRHKEHEILQRVANDVRRERERQRRVQRNHPERHHPEREIAERQIEVLRLALAALREGGRPHSAELVELAIRAREVGLEGRRDEEARTIRRRSPNRAQTIELLMLAEELYREFDLEHEAATISRLTEELWSDRGRRRAQRERPHGLHQIEVMKSAVRALVEADRKDAAELLERAIVAREVGVVREPAPSDGQVVEILNLASRLWREFGDLDKSDAVSQVAKEMWADHERARAPRGERRRQRDREPLDRINMLEARVAELQETIEALIEELHALGEPR